MGKRILKIAAILLILSPLLLSLGILIGNNAIAARIEQNLKAHPLPENTELVDSLYVAGKVVGNGNGMQYLGCLLVESDLDEQQLKTYYEQSFDYIEVHPQESEKLDFIRPGYRFESFDADAEKTYFAIACWDDNRSEYVGDFIKTLLDMDIRGH